MTKLATCLVVVCIILLPLSAAAQGVAVWYLPHPDDETIGMANAIYESVLAGNTNYLVYFSKGKNSLARHNLKGPDGSVFRLSPEEFGQARVKETLASLAVLGIGPENVLFFDYPDGAIPEKAVETTIEYFANLYPGASHHTVSTLDDHEDHQTLARTLAQTAKRFDPELPTEYYHVYIYRNPQLMSEEGIVKRPVTNPDIKRRALAEFSHWDPENGRYAVASSSTPDLISAAAASDYEYVQTSGVMQSRGAKTVPFFKASNLGLELGLPINSRLEISGGLNFSGAFEAGLALRLQDDIPLVQLSTGIGFQFGYNKPYISATAEVGRNYFATIRYIWKTDTQLGIGLKANLF